MSAEQKGICLGLGRCFVREVRRLFRSVSVLAVAIVMSASGTRAEPQLWSERALFAPYPLDGRTNYFDQNIESVPAFDGLASQQNASSPRWLTEMTMSVPIGLGELLGTQSVDKSLATNIWFKDPPSVLWLQKLPALNDQWLPGVNNLSFQTERMTPTPVPFRRSDCTEDECADYSPLPKVKHSKTTTKNFRKPYIGLSVTSPFQ